MPLAAVASHGIPTSWRIILWGGIAALLLAPAIAMRFTREVNWSAGDFIVAAGLLGLTGIGLELAARVPGSRFRRMAIAGAILGLLMIVWIELAVGIL